MWSVSAFVCNFLWSFLFCFIFVLLVWLLFKLTRLLHKTLFKINENNRERLVRQRTRNIGNIIICLCPLYCKTSFSSRIYIKTLLLTLPVPCLGYWTWVARRQSVTQGSMGREAPVTFLWVQDYKKVKKSMYSIVTNGTWRVKEILQ